MKNKKNYIIGMLLLIASNQYTNDENTQENIRNAAIAIPTVAAIAAWKSKLSPFGIMLSIHNSKEIFASQILAKFKETDTYIQDNYPYAQAWYHNLAQQNLKTQLNQYKILKSQVSTVDAIGGSTETGFKCVAGRIFIPEEDLKIINNLYKKKIDGQPLTAEEELSLGSAQWTILHEAGHLKHNDLTQGPLIFAATSAVVETGYQLCKHKMIRPLSWPKYLGLHAAIYAGMCVTLGTLYNTYSRYRETRADKFANEHADDQALLGGKDFFEKFKNQHNPNNSTLIKILSSSSTHPTLESRIQAIDTEILHRKELKK